MKIGMVPEASRREHFISSLRTMATITEREDGGPMRPVGRRRGVRPGGLYASHKNGRMVGWESRAERDAFYCSEVDTRVVAYRSQPHTIEALIEGRVRRYTPDIEERLSDGTIRIVEVKEEFEAKRDEDYALKLAFFGDVYRALGWSFQIVERATFGEGPKFRAVSKVQSHRRTGFDASDLARVRMAIAGEGGGCTLGDLTDLFRNSVVGVAVVSAMMVGRYVEIDLANDLVPTARVAVV